MFLCSNSLMTCRMSLTLWYSMVAFQCLNVWKLMLRMRGFWSLSARALKDKHITMYARRKSSGEYQEKDYYKWERPYLENSVGFKHIQENCQKCLLNPDLYDFAELVDIKPGGGEFIHSMSEPFSEGGMDQIESVVIQRWLDHFNLKFHQAHAPGHCSQDDLSWLIEEINPKRVIPIHTENSEMFTKITKAPITKPEYQKAITIR